MKRALLVICLLIAFGGVAGAAESLQKTRPADFVDIRKVAPSVIVEMRYATAHNFMGKKVPGYEAPRCLLTKKAAEALAKAQDDLKGFSLSLKVYDCYRPQRAVDAFDAWSKDLGDTKMKAEFYPFVEKENMFRDVYIAHKSGHSRGSAVDLTIVDLPAASQEKYVAGDALRSCLSPAGERFKDNGIDMGTGYDCFDPISNTFSEKIGVAQRINRALLKGVMEKNGFVFYDKEWWHFKLADEPYPGTYFDFQVK